MTSRLNALEAAYLWLEEPGRPIHVGAVAYLEGGPLLNQRGRLRLKAVRELIATRCDEHPILRRRIVPAPLGIDRPHWAPDPDFDVARHVEEIHLSPPGDEAALQEVAAEVHTRLLDYEHPMWHLCFVTGLADGRVGLVERAHHALVDGVGGVDLAAVFLDASREVPEPGPARIEPYETGNGSLLDAALGGPVRTSARLAASAVGALRDPGTALRGGAALARGMASLVSEGVLAPGSSINGPPGTTRRFAWVRTRVDDVKQAGRRHGATVNDIVLAAVTTGLRSLLLERREPLAHELELKAMVPVSVRSPDETGSYGNRVTAMVAPLPVGLGDPDRRLAAIIDATRRLKASGEATTLGALLEAADTLPLPVTRTLVRGLRYQPFINLVVTNVPGPPFPLYLFGAELLEAFPVVPLAVNLSVGVAIMSYNGALTISLNADADTWPDLAVFARGVEEGLRQLGAHRPAAA